MGQKSLAFPIQDAAGQVLSGALGRGCRPFARARCQVRPPKRARRAQITATSGAGAGEPDERGGAPLFVSSDGSRVPTLTQSSNDLNDYAVLNTKRPEHGEARQVEAQVEVGSCGFRPGAVRKSGQTCVKQMSPLGSS